MKKCKALMVLLFLPFAAGCSIFGEQIVEEVAEVVDKYCEEPQQARELYRAQVNAELEYRPGGGESVTVVCEGDE